MKAIGNAIGWTGVFILAIVICIKLFGCAPKSDTMNNSPGAEQDTAAVIAKLESQVQVLASLSADLRLQLNSQVDANAALVQKIQSMGNNNTVTDWKIVVAGFMGMMLTAWGGFYFGGHHERRKFVRAVTAGRKPAPTQTPAPDRKIYP